MVVATAPGDAYQDTYATGYTQTVTTAAADATTVSELLKATRSLTRAGADTATSGDAATALFRPYRTRALTETAHATDVAVATFTPAPGTAGNGGVHLRVYDLHGTLVPGALIPEFQQIQVQDERNQPGVLTASLPLSSPGVQTLRSLPFALIGVVEGGRQIGMFVYDEDDNDDADQAGTDAELSVSAPGTMSLLTWAALYPQAGFDTPNYVDFIHVTPGAVLSQILATAQARGTLDGVHGPRITLSFDANHDSDGNEWPVTVWIRYDSGKTMLDVALDLASKGYLDLRMRGLTLDAYIASGTPEPATNVLPNPLTNDAQGWTVVGAASATTTGARDTSSLPGGTSGVTAAYALTSTVAAAPTDPNDPNYGIVPFADMEALTPLEPVTPGATYVAAVLLAAAAASTGRNVLVGVRWYSANSQASLLREDTLTSAADTPGSYLTAAGTVTAPTNATYGAIHVTVQAATRGEVHRIAKPLLTGNAPSSVQRDLPGVVLRRTDWVQSAPSRRQRSAIETVKLGLGEGNLSLEVSDATAVATYGRREGVSNQGGVQDYGTLVQLARIDLDRAKVPKTGLSVTYVRNPDRAAPPQPWSDYFAGNWIRCDWKRNADGTLAAQRVSSITATYDTTGVAAATVELNDLFLELDEQLARQASGLLVSSSPTSPGGSTPIVTTDSTPPAAVGAVTVATSTLLNPDGSYQALATVAWPAVLLNADGTPYTGDFGNYAVQWRVGNYADTTSGWSGAQTTGITQVTVAALPPGAVFQARVLPVDSNGNYPKNADGSPAYSLSAFTTLRPDGVAPGQPAAPTVTPLPGGLSVLPSALDSGGGPMPADFHHFEVHVSTVTGFTPSTLLAAPTVATLADTLIGAPGASSTVLTTGRLAYGIDYYLRIVAVDTAGNRSAAGVQAGPFRMRTVGPADLDPAALTNTDHSAMLGADAGWHGGSAVADPASRTGTAVLLTAGQVAHYAGYQGLKPGRYRATFAIRTDAAAAVPPAAVATVDAAGDGLASDGTRPVTTSDAAAGQGYRTVSVLFTVATTAASVDLPVANASATASVWLSHAYIEPVASMGVAEIRDAMVADLSATKLTAGTMTADIIAAADALGNPGRIRVGVVNPVTGVADQPGFEIGSRGMRAQGAGGVPTLLVDPVTGSVQVTGSIQAGSDLPSSTFSANLVQNSAMEDPVPGSAPGTVPPRGWTDGWETDGDQGASAAYADTSSPLAGATSLTIRTDAPTAGRAVASHSWPVTPGERLQVTAQLRQNGLATPVRVRLVFGADIDPGPAQLVAATPAVPDNCQALNLDGTVAVSLDGASGPGWADVAGSWVPAVSGSAYKVTGSVLAPPGAAWCRAVVEVAGRGGAAAGSAYTTFDNVSANRSQDGHTLIAATVTGPIIQTATEGPRVVISSTEDTRGVYFYGSDPTKPPASFEQIDNLAYGISAVQFESNSGAAFAGGYDDKMTLLIDAFGSALTAYSSAGSHEIAHFGMASYIDPLLFAENAVNKQFDLLNDGQNQGSLGGQLFLRTSTPSGDYTASLKLGTMFRDSGTGTQYNTQLTGGLIIQGPFASFTAGGGVTPKTFVIDHPTDADRWLVHGALEGPEAGVYYRGKGRLVDGRCDVELPPYFEAATLVEGRTVQLTPIITEDEHSALVAHGEDHVAFAAVANLAATRVRDGRFAVLMAGGVIVPDQEFCWEVKAVRADLPLLDAEPLRREHVAHGDGPYRWLEKAVPSPA